MTLKKIAPWNWFKNEEEENRSEFLPARASAHRHPCGNTWYPESMDRLGREMDRLLENTFGEFGFESPLARLTGSDLFRPRVDIAASEKEYSITMEVPGIDKKDVAIEVNGNTMTIRGKKEQSSREETKHFYRMERSYGSFHRVLSLPGDADRNRMEATFKDGLLTVTLPRKDTPRSWGKQIEIREG